MHGLFNSYLRRAVQWPQAFNQKNIPLSLTLLDQYLSSNYNDTDFWRIRTNPLDHKIERELLESRRVEIITNGVVLPYTINPYLHLRLMGMGDQMRVFDHMPVRRIFQDEHAFLDIDNFLSRKIDMDLSESRLSIIYQRNVLNNPNSTFAQSGPMMFMQAIEEWSGKKSQYPLSDFIHLHDPLAMWEK